MHRVFHETKEYTPTIFFNDFWDLRENMQEINTTTTSLPLNITFGPIGLTK